MKYIVTDKGDGKIYGNDGKLAKKDDVLEIVSQNEDINTIFASLVKQGYCKKQSKKAVEKSTDVVDAQEVKEVVEKNE